MNELRNLEALLFVVGEEGISLEELSYLLNLDTASTFELIEQLKEKYQGNEESALHILEAGNHFVLTTKKECAELLKQYAQSPISNNLSQAALETLSIVAYKQPITRVQIDQIRGVQSTGAVQKLVARQLIEEKGRVEGPGRAILYGTTDYFMDFFGLKSLEELPNIEGMEEQLEEEMPFDLFFDRYNQSELSMNDPEAAVETEKTVEDENKPEITETEQTEEEEGEA